MNRCRIYACLSLAALLLAACSNTKNLPAGDSLYVGSQVDIKDPENTNSKERKVLKNDLNGAVLPKPNSKFLGMRLKLAIYNFAGTPKKEKGLRNWLRKIGEAPVLASTFDPDKNNKLLANILENRGFFYPYVSNTTKTKARKTKAYFDVRTGPQYKIRNVEFMQDSTQLSKDIYAQKDKSLLKTGAPFNLDLIKGERDRIDRQLKELGYYYFTPDYLIILTDSTVGETTEVDMYVKVKRDIPDEATRSYRINDIYIYPNYILRSGTGQARAGRDSSRRRPRVNDTLVYKNYHIVGNTRMYKPFVFSQAMQFQPGDVYNRTEQNISLNRLVNMGTFKFVKNEFQPIEGEPPLLDAFYYLTPYPKKSLQAELGGFTKSDSRVGSQLTLSWRNRNTLRGAELFAVKLTGGFETQSGGTVKRPNTYQAGIQPSLTIPRFVIPFIEPKSSSMFVPRTTIRAGYDFIYRENLYLLHSFNGGYGFQWKEDIRREHQLFPINITYVKTDTLNRDTNLNINYSNLVFDGLIIGPTYDFTYNTRVGAPNKHDFYFNGMADLSGNILGLAQGTSINESPKTIFGAQYAQYVKLQTDLRYYLNYGADPASIWANRLILGFGLPYGNSRQLPNIKQFFAGGNSSLRGFRSRLVGPGTFNYLADSTNLIETAGDIKLEFNTELRSKLYSFIHGAIFLDAGNVWTYRDNPIYTDRSGRADKGTFDTDFLKELAIDVGVGLRLDFNILVLRLDLGMPIHKPWLPEGQRWTFSNLNLGDADARRENLIFNLAIGYPF